ncbi:hypothetical protein R1flu_020404 [Riccia fluitans]|uniref:Uncharacterized protein n=1 Tax=Riccia fluitans TaxID=41844 RepID=A0ABD1ZLE8_9MARC
MLHKLCSAVSSLVESYHSGEGYLSKAIVFGIGVKRLPTPCAAAGAQRGIKDMCFQHITSYKELLTHAIFRRVGVTFFAASASKFMEMFVGKEWPEFRNSPSIIEKAIGD